MAPLPLPRLPTLTAISNTYKVPSATRSLVKSLSRLSRSSLIDLALQWLQPENEAACAPYLASNRNLDEEAEEDYLYQPAENIEMLRTKYENLKLEKGTKRDIIDRILDGDWRRGISLQQLAMIDFQYLSDHDASLRWTALKLLPLKPEDNDVDQQPAKKKPRLSITEPAPFPRIQPSSFLQALQREICPFVKAHYFMRRLHSPENITVLRLYVADTPYAIPAAGAQSFFTDAARTMFIALPDSCPYIYIALSGSGGGACNSNAAASKADIMALKRTVLEAVPKALSMPQERYALGPTAMTARSLRTVCALRGNGRTNAAGGTYSVFADANVDESPLEAVDADFGPKVMAEEVVRGDEQEPRQDSRIETGVASRSKHNRRILGERSANMERRQDRRDAKMKNITVARRFGTVGLSGSGHKAPIDRLQMKLDEALFVTGQQMADKDLEAPASATGAVSSASTSREKSQPDPVKQLKKPSSLLDSFNPNQNATKLVTSSKKNNNIASTLPPSSDSSHITLTLTFHGTDVFAGIRNLAETTTHLDLGKTPMWMTGEENVSNAVVRNGVVVRGWGSGGGDGGEG